MYHRKSKTELRSIRLNAQGWYVEKIAVHFNWTPQIVREVLHKWKKLGMEGLWELPGLTRENLDGVKKTSYF
jgi:hypothetical protein